MRPDIGTQANFRKKKAPTTYRYDSSLSPTMEWDGQNGVRELGEWLLARVEEAAALPAPHAFDGAREFVGPDGVVRSSVRSLQVSVAALKRLGKPFLNWTGKAERLSFDVPTLPLFVHERLSTKAIVETLVGHKKDKQIDMYDLFGDPQHSIVDQTLKAYEHKDRWVNRMVLGDSLVVMNSLLQYEGLGGPVQMIYIDPPYGVKFGSNFQPFVRKRDVSHNDDKDLTREPEMVNAYRDTWELGLHSGPGSTADVDYWTSKPVREVLRSHLNYVVADTKRWEQIAGDILDNHAKVMSFVKNDGLGFAIPYFHNGQPHDYLPDFTVKTRAEPPVHLILETKGFDELAEIKAAAAERWVAAVNAEGSHGAWRYAMARAPHKVREILDSL